MSKDIRKVYTDNPIIDEIVYQCQIMIKDIVLKDEQRANENETLESIKASDMYATVIEGKAKFNHFKYNMELLKKIPSLNYEDIIIYAQNNAIIPEAIRPQLLELAKEEFLNNYKEKNNYYRMLNGLPDLGDSGIKLNKSQIEILSSVTEFDTRQYIHDMDTNDINILEQFGILDDLINSNPDLLYLKHLGKRKIDPYIARKTPMFGLLYLPSEDIASEVYNKFQERLEINRVFTLKTIYSEAHKFNSDYYDRFMMIMIILQSFDDMIVLSPEYIIRRDLFDLRTIQYIFDACGVEFFPEIPLKYQKRLVKNLNRLLKYSSCNKNLVDIASLFGYDNLQLFKYYMLKEPVMLDDNTYAEYVTEDPKTGEPVSDLENNFQLKFLKVPIDDIADNYIRDKMNYLNYDDVVDQDIWWNGLYTKEYVKHTILEREFNIVISKYLGIDTIYSLSELSFELVYFINMIMFSGSIDNSQTTIQIPEFSTTEYYPFIDTLICLYSLMYLYEGVEDKIFYDPIEALAIKGFNFDVDMNYLVNYVEERGYTLEELGIDFQIPKNGIMSFNQLIEVYTKNKNVRNLLIEGMDNADNKKIYDIYKTLYQSLMITNLNYDYYRKGNNGEVPETYAKYLSNKGSSLYKIIRDCEVISNTEERRIEVSRIINIIIDNIYLYLDEEEFRYIFQNIPTVSIDYVRTYLFKVLNFFKSYKTEFLKPKTIYVFDDKLDNKIQIIDEIIFNYIFNRNDRIRMDDYKDLLVHLNPKDDIGIFEKIYIDISYFEKYDFKEYILFRDRIANILVYLNPDDYGNLDYDEIYEKIYVYTKSEVIRSDEYIDSNIININYKDKSPIHDLMYLDFTYKNI